MDCTDNCSIGTESDSGVGRSHHSITARSSRAPSTLIEPPTSTANLVQQELWLDFHTSLWYSRIPPEFHPTSNNQLEFLSLWFDVSQIEAWLLEKMTNSTTDGKASVEEFFQEVKLFSVRSGPEQLIRALHNLGILQPGEQLTNGFTAFQTAAMWRNCDAVTIFGHTNPQSVFLQLENSPENLEYFSQMSPLDGAAFQYSGEPEELLKFLHPEDFGFPALTVLLRLKSSLDVDYINSLFLKAVERGQDFLADLLLCLFGASVDDQQAKTARTGLHIAGLKAQVILAELLLRRNANPNIMTAENELPEDLAPRKFKKQFISILTPYRTARFENIRNSLSRGDLLDQHIVPADFASTDDHGQSILAIAVIRGNGDTGNLEKLLQVPGCPVNTQNCRTGRCVLAEAVAVSHTAAVSMLLKNNAKPGVRDFADWCPLDIAIEQDNLAMVNTMMQFPQCWTGLHAAMRLSKSAEMTEALQAAFKRRQEELVAPVLFSATIGQRDFDSTVALQLGSLEQGDLVNGRNELGETPTFLAAKNGCIEALQVIIELGGQFWSRHCRTLETTLHVAAAGGFSEVIKFLVDCYRKHKRKLNLDEMDNEGRTPLYRAAEGGHTEAARTLLELGASANGYVSHGVLLTSSFESTQAIFDEYRLPRQIMIFRSIEKGNLKILKSVWESPFDHYLRNHMGDTPIMVAAQMENLKILDFLMESAEQEYRPYELDLNRQHDANVECMLHRIETRPDLASVTPLNPLQPPPVQQLTCYQWIFGRVHPDQPDNVPTLFLSEYRLSHVSATNLNDGCCALHRVIEVADNVDAIKRLVTKDPFCINIPEHNGFTSLHLAIILRRSKIIRFLLKHETTDFYATDLLGRLPEELADTPKLLELIRMARTQPSSWWESMCDEQIPLSTADGLSNWTSQFKSVNWSDAGSNSQLGSSAQFSIFAGKTSASQDGVFEFIDRSRSARNSKAAREPSTLATTVKKEADVKISPFSTRRLD